MKKPLRKLLHAQGNIHDRVTKLRTELDEVQTALDRNPSSTMLREEDGVYLTAFTQALIDEERFLKQKAKIDWLKVGNSNLAFFHRSVKERVSRTRIDCIHGQDNVVYEGSAVPHLFVNHYTNFLGTKSSTTTLNQVGLFGRKLNASKAEAMIREVTNEEIKRDMFSIGNDKAPSPNSYTSVFYKKAWNIVGNDVCSAVHDFFVNGKLLQEVNHTILTLLPKVHSAKITFDVLEEFKEASGLVPSTPKSTVFLCNVLDQVKSSILNLMPFEEGILPIKYLGVPLISTRLLHKDCKILGKAKVAWEDVCLPKIEGGLVIWKLHTFNVALMSSHVWKILTNQETLAINTGGFNMQEKVVDIVHENAWACNTRLDGNEKKVKTQDRLWKWDVGNDVDLNLLRCPLCKLQPDSYEHLFFECSYSSNVWKSVLRVPEFPDIPPIWTNIMAWIVPLAETKNVTCIVGHLIVAAMSYYIETSVNQFQEKDASGQYKEDMETAMARVMEAY
ncbi:reverse transcriptase domain, reverse transcriptase zinc-binding domain protein [Tanacetum coccineum]|uniref:Reverse transcriptase domain, reverse transcriptase zinc-binding domain protein n=1 Tax=Tanacetum coccineum TaxID=301880 RepID=A0ABQ5IQX9_9ASTR